ncbi:pyridoxal phosphate-dependent aminotransferase [Streptomyces sp. RY43-2]|uniref:Pyridoxal phosphate-dependent aminotransferase n=1 Tax=Streptomyces macrolidinus TaxID=2952607 RepID=A0ABT0ZIZ7_9ACTN|nr:pyridoxal phosphate-dependent aminotransferase [Streptomyces macrolidinus]MCN9243550.1 pyridoxal phosphate-dependent aminotransferase [Streptomyces macrolidinus]
MTAARGRLSRRVSGIGAMELAGLMRLAHDVGAIDIALGIPPGDPPAAAIEAATAALTSAQNQYAPPEGLLSLRQLIAAELLRTRGVAVDPVDEITVTCGATEGVLAAVLAVTDPGDEVILPEPFYENYPGVIGLTGAVHRPVPLAGRDWRLDLDAVRAAITGRTRAVLLNTPHNPTGRAFDQAEVSGLLELCVEHDLVLITDEVYERYVYDGRTHVSPLGMPGTADHVIAVGSLSKSLHMSGWRVGYCVASPELTAGIRRVHERTTVGAARPLQQGVSAVGAADFIDDRALFQERRDHLVAYLETLGFDVRMPEGGWFVLAGSSGLAARSDKLVAELVETAGVLLAPGTSFFADRADGLNWVRTTFVRDRERTVEALERMRRFLTVTEQSN